MRDRMLRKPLVHLHPEVVWQLRDVKAVVVAHLSNRIL